MEANLLFVGGTYPGLRALESLIRAGVSIVGVVPTIEGEHEHARFSEAVIDIAHTADIPVMLSPTGAELSFREIMTSCNPTIVFCTGARRMIPSWVLDSVPLCIGTHFALLPHYRGFAPVNWALINGETETGVSVFHLAAEMDSGDLVAQWRISIDEVDTAWTVLAKCTDVLCDELPRLIEQIVSGTAARIPQDGSRATYTCSRCPEDGVIDWSRPTREIHNLSRALAWPFPGARTMLDSQPIIINKTHVMSDSARYVGRVTGRVVGFDGDHVHVLAGDGVIAVEQVLVPTSQQILPAREVVRSVRATFGR